MSDQRKRWIAQIHIAKTQLGMSEDAYRALLKRHGSASSADMSLAQLGGVLHELKQKGFKTINKKRGPKSSVKPSTGDKIRALWLTMHAQGIVRSADETALRAYVRRISNGRYDAPQFCDGFTAHRVIESLKQWQERVLFERQKAARDAKKEPRNE